MRLEEVGELMRYPPHVVRDAKMLLDADRETFKTLEEEFRYYPQPVNLVYAKRFLDWLERQGFPVEEAADIFRRWGQALLHGRSKIAMLGACVYLVARRRHIPLSINEIKRWCRCPRRRIYRYYQLLVQASGVPVPDGVDLHLAWLKRGAEELGAPREVLEDAADILRRFKRRMGRNPKVVAASCLYLATERHGLQISFSRLAEVFTVTEISVRNTVYEILNELQEEADR